MKKCVIVKLLSFMLLFLSVRPSELPFVRPSVRPSVSPSARHYLRFQTFVGLLNYLSVVSLMRTRFSF